MMPTFINNETIIGIASTHKCENISIFNFRQIISTINKTPTPTAKQLAAKNI